MQPARNEESSLFLSRDSIQVVLRLPADSAYLGNALQTLEEICEQVEVSRERGRRARLAVEESMLNALEYAYRQGDEGFVEIQFVLENQCLMVVIEDFGVGFEVASLPRLPDRHEDILADRGRGHIIVRSMADHVSIDSTPGRGTRVTMRFDRVSS